MLVDRYSGHHSISDSSALAHFEEAVFNVAAHRPLAGEALGRALNEQPNFIAAHALKGFAGVMLARQESACAARGDFASARRAIKARRATGSEIALVEALGLAVAGRLLDAAARLDMHLVEAPQDFLALKLSHSLRFMSGDSRGMLRTTDAALGAWSPSMPGYGFVLGCHAFGLEETCHFAAAERFGRRAVAAEAADAWGLHAVGHVCEMQGRAEEGAAWLEASRPTWSACNNFSFHMAWHLALFYLAQGRAPEALALYDREVRPTQTDDFRDVANAVSFLVRLRHEGVDVGDRWAGLSALALKRTTDATYVFGSLHHLLTLSAVGDLDAAGRLTSALATRVQAYAGAQSEVAELVGVPFARTVLAHMRGQTNAISFGEIAHRLATIGGSNAQRDIFLRTLAMIAAEEGRRDDLVAVLRIQRGFRTDERFERLVYSRLAAHDRTAA